MKEKRHIRLKKPMGLFIPALLWAFGIAYLWGSRTMLWSDGFLAMRICFVLMLAFTIPVVVKEFTVMNDEEYQSWKGQRKNTQISTATKRIAAMVAALIVYLLLMQPLGFAIATYLFTLGIMLWLGVRNKVVLVLAPILSAGILFFVFKYVLYVRLPLGLLTYVL